MSTDFARLSPEEREIVLPFLSEVPVRIGALALKLGLEVKSASLSPSVSGQLQRANTAKSGFRIRVNKHEAANRQRFTIAHEIAHYLLHRDQIGEGIEDSILYRSSLQDAREAEANRLAADLLMPRSKVAQRLRSLGRPPIKEDSLRFAEEFQVSEAAMSIRLGLTV